MEANVVKGGELCLRVGLARTAKGLTVNVKVSPLIEKFMMGLGNGEKQQVDLIARNWIPEKDDQPLFVWAASNQTLAQLANATRYTLAYPGRPLDVSEQIGQDTTNLSFLRLVGASEGNGITFHMKNSVYSLDALREMKNKIGNAARNLYVDFIRPAELNVYVTQISSQEMLG